MEIEIKHKGINFIVEGEYTEGESPTYYDLDLAGHPGSNSEFEIKSIKSSENLFDLFSFSDLSEITDLVIEKI